MKRILLFILCIIIIWIWTDLNPFHILHMMKKGESDLTDQIRHADISIGYVLNESAWTRFRIHQQNEGIKVLTNANFSRLLPFDPEKQYWYTVRYQVLDHNHNILADHNYVHRTRLTRYTDENNIPAQAQFYMDKTLIPLDTRIMRIHLSEIKGDPWMIRFRLEWKEPGVTDVIIRAYIKEITSELKKGHLWHRFSEEQKARLAKGNVFPHDLLRDAEKRNLVQAMYRPMGPMGIEGKSYTTRELYVATNMEGRWDDITELPMGLYIDQYHHGVIPLPMEGGMVFLDFNGGFATPSGGNHQVTLRWFGRGPADRMSRMILWQGDKQTFHAAFQGGMLELRSDRPLTVRVFLEKPSTENEITPDPIYVRAYKIDPENPVTYDIHHSGRTPTPFRADFRYTQNARETPVRPPITIRYELIDRNDQVIQKGHVIHADTLSFYDDAGSPVDGSRVSEPVSRYFRLPENVKKVRFHADAPVIVNTYNRPFGLIKETRVPEDYFKYHLEDTSRQATWFELSPANRKQITMDSRMIMLKLQYRPPEDREELLTGDYEWEAFYPENSWQGRYLFTPFESMVVRSEQIPSLYTPIPMGKDTAITFRQPVKGLVQVDPTVLFFRETPTSGLFRVLINGKPLVRRNIIGRRGEIALPDLPAGTYHLHVSSPPGTSAYINYADPGNLSNLRLKRFALKMDHHGLKFNYEKKSMEEEVLSVRFYQSIGSTLPAVIRIRIHAGRSASLNAFNDYTLVDRRYTIQQGKTRPQVPVLNTMGLNVDQGNLFFLSLGQDLPQGSYTIQFTIEQGDAGYLVFSGITLGAYEKRQFHKERGGINDILY